MLTGLQEDLLSEQTQSDVNTNAWIPSHINPHQCCEITQITLHILNKSQLKRKPERTRTLLFLTAHDGEERGESGHDDQRNGDGHGTDRSGPRRIN